MTNTDPAPCPNIPSITSSALRTTPSAFAVSPLVPASIVPSNKPPKRYSSTDRQRESLRRLRGYFLDHSERLCYRERLSGGRVIGSGQVEGACKSMVGLRLKQTGAQWKVRRLNRMLSLCSLRYSDVWEEYWRTTNASAYRTWTHPVWIHSQFIRLTNCKP